MTLYPALYQVNTRVWLTELSQALGRPATLDDVPDAALDRMADLGFDWVWFLSVWRTGLAGRRRSRAHPELRKEFEETLPDLREEDIAGSGFAITGYTVAPSLGGDAAIERLRQRLAERGLKLMLDFIPNHTGLDHPWVHEHPEYYVAGTAADLVREHLDAEIGYQGKLTRGLENHDEPRAAAAFPLETHKAAALITFLAPGIRLFHHGQFEGRRLRISPHLIRAPIEPCHEALPAFYDGLLAVLRLSQLRHGRWRLLECLPAWEGNWTMDEFLAFAWEEPDGDPLLVTVNYASHQSQCYVRLPFPDLDGRTVRLSDLLGPARYDRDGSELATRGLYLDLPPWGYHLFALSTETPRKKKTTK
jgi:hypothetical protein